MLNKIEKLFMPPIPKSTITVVEVANHLDFKTSFSCMELTSADGSKRLLEAIALAIADGRQHDPHFIQLSLTILELPPEAPRAKAVLNRRG